MADITITGKPPRKKFEKACERCNKVLKSAKTYNTHIKHQLCYSKNEITYCKLCDITMENHIEYVKHLLTMEHINKIGCNKLEVLHSNQPSTILQADPYLTNNEARSIGTNNLGAKFTFVFENNTTQTINLVNTPTNENTTVGITNGAGRMGTHIPSQRQIKILGLLTGIGTIKEGVKLLTVMLENKLNIEDYNGLQKLIQNDGKMTTEYKNVYLSIIEQFVASLIGRRAKGETLYNGKDISKLVISLTN